MLDEVDVQYVRLTEAQKPVAYLTLLGGATLLKKWAEFYHPKKFRQFRNAVMKGDKNPLGKIPSNRLTEFHGDLSHILAIRQEMPELDGRSPEQAVLQNFVALAKQHARQWCHSGDQNGSITRRDYLQEAYMTIVETMYHYTREDIEFSTFVWWSLRNRMINVTGQDNFLSRLSNSDLKLMFRYEKAKQDKFGTFDEIVDSIGLSDKESKKLGSILIKVLSENQFSTSDKDYTGNRADIVLEGPMLRTEEADGEIISVVDIEGQEYVDSVLNKAELSFLERKVFEAAMNENRGWQTEFAKSHINSDTGKPYSRMRITQLLVLARAKIAAVIQKEAA